MPVVVFLLLVGFIIYKYFGFILGWILFGGLAYGFYRFVIKQASSQGIQQVRRPVSSGLAVKPFVYDEPLDNLTDDEPSADAVTEEVYDALENETARAVGKDGEERVNCILGQTVMDYLSDVYLEDDLGLTQVDHIAKMAWGLVVIETKTYGGFISETRNPRRWKQSFRQFGSTKYYVFQNPVDQNFRHLSAVKHITGLNEHVFSMVVFAGSARTSRRVHQQIVRIRVLKRALRERPTSRYIPDGRRDAAWEKLRQHAIANLGREEEHLAGLKRKMS